MVDELLRLLSDPAHWAFEGITDLAFAGLAVVIGRHPFRRWLERHDREKHGA